MLQQTGVSTVIPYFERWMQRFPSVQDLACASEEDVLSLWQGLGYYRRARNLLAGAKFVAERNPMSPEDWGELPLLKIPGVGRYTAGAIASIALNQPEPLVDGNVERVYARQQADPTPKPTAAAWKWAAQELRQEAPGDWNQALMELGATICTPKNPKCSICPVLEACRAYELGLVDQFPASSKKPQVVPLTLDVWVVEFEGKLGLLKQREGQWWHGLWTSPFTPHDESSTPPFEGSVQPMGSLKHVVTHHRITLRLHRLEAQQLEPTLDWFGSDAWTSLPMPAWQRKVVKILQNTLL